MSTETTNVVGFFNPNNYPMQIVVAEHNLTLQLKPKQWIVDRGGRIVNDPILDKYVGKGRLSRASDQSKKVDVVRLQAINRQVPPGQAPATYQHPVYQATGFVRDPNGQMVAVQALPTAPQPTVPPPVSYNPVQAMSVEQARKLRLIKPVRYVPEDDGVSDTSGVPIPGDQTPPIKYAVDTTREKQPTALMAQPATAEQEALIEAMKSAQSLDPDAATFADDVAALAMRAQAQGSAPVAQTVPPPLPTSPLLDRMTKALPSSPPPIPTNPEPTVMIPTELPDPVLTPEPSSQVLVVEEEIGLLSSANPATASVPAEGAAKPATACPLCPGQAFSSPGYLVRHINRKHADRAESLMRQLGLV